MSFPAALIASDRRLYPNSPIDFPPKAEGSEVASNERFSFQAVLRNPNPYPIQVTATPSGTPWRVVTRRVGYVPVRHLNTGLGEVGPDVEGAGQVPGYVPDPLFEETTFWLAPRESHAFWFTVYPPEGGAPAGDHPIRVELALIEDDKPQPPSHTLTWPVKVHAVTLPPRRDFPITHWFYADTLMDWYRCDGFDERFWAIARRFITNLAEHGSTMLLVPWFTPPLDGVKRPSQLLRIEADGEGETARYRFDWSDVRHYLQLASECGITHFEWSHLFTQWGVENAIRIYHGQGEGERLLWPPETPATSRVYRHFLAQLLPEFHTFLQELGLMDVSYFHLSDEPHLEHRDNYRAAREMIRELAPWMQIMDAMTDLAFASDGSIDLPIPSIETAPKFAQAGVASGCYYCCFPRDRYLNRLMETPLAKIGMHGFLFYRWPFRLFLHWGYNYWQKRMSRTLVDPFSTQDAEGWPIWAYGDPFVVYPGDEKPIDSIRWEVFAESLQDYALLQSLEVDRADPLLAPLASFEEFPKSARWRREARRTLLARAAEKQAK